MPARARRSVDQRVMSAPSKVTRPPRAGWQAVDFPGAIRALQSAVERPLTLRPVRRLDVYEWDGRPVRETDAFDALVAGFVDSLNLSAEEEPERMLAISLWKSRADAERYHRDHFSGILDAIRPFLRDEPSVEFYNVETSTAHRITTKAA